jgi:hypothetical protein
LHKAKSPSQEEEMFKISGLDELTKQLEQAQQAFEELDGDLGEVNFDPHDPASIEAAIQRAHAMLDAKAALWEANPLVAQVVEGLKEQYRESILERAVAARLEGSDE